MHFSCSRMLLTFVRLTQSSSESWSLQRCSSEYWSKYRSIHFRKGTASLSIFSQEFHLVPLSLLTHLPREINFHCCFRCGVRPMWTTKLWSFLRGPSLLYFSISLSVIEESESESSRASVWLTNKNDCADRLIIWPIHRMRFLMALYSMPKSLKRPVCRLVQRLVLFNRWLTSF